MKKLILVFCLLCLPYTAYADYGCDSYCEEMSEPDVINNITNNHLNRKRRNPVGAGFDIPLYKSKKLIIDQETKLDWSNGFSNGGLSTYTVVKPQLNKGIFQTIGSFIKRLFNKGE